MHLLTGLLLAIQVAPGSPGVASDTPALHVAIGWGVDTVASPNREIFALWRAYLSRHPEAGQKTDLWSAAEQARWPAFDLLRLVYQGFPKLTVVQLAPAAGLDSTWVIRTLVAGVYDSAQDVKPLALYRVYATRESGRWVLANALPRTTRTWKRVTIGPVTFVYPPTHRFDRVDARGSARFVDSLARAFGVPVPAHLTYYVADNVDEIQRAWGLEYFPTGPDTIWGQTIGNAMVVTAGAGERHRHELAHHVLAPLFQAGHGNRLVAEGLATWVGGMQGIFYPKLLPALRRYLAEHPEVTLDSVFENPPQRQGTLDVGYVGAAVLCATVYAAGGVAAVRELAAAGPLAETVLAVAARLVGVSPGDLDGRWRRELGIRRREGA